MATQLSDVVRVSAEIRASGGAASGFGSTLFLTTESGLAGAGPSKVMTFSTLAQVGVALGTTSEAYRAATAHFSQDGSPRQFHVGRWAATDVPTTLTGGEINAADALDQVGSITSGSFRYADRDFVLTLAGRTSLAGVASAIQTAIQAMQSSDSRLGNVTVTVVGGRMVVTDPDGADLGSEWEPHSGNTGTFIGPRFGMTAATGASYRLGKSAETLAAAVTEINEYVDWYFLTLERRYHGTVEGVALAAARGTGNRIAILQSGEASALVADDSVSNLSAVTRLDNPRVIAVWSSHSDYLGVALAARMGAANLDSPASIITLNLKSLPGIEPSSLTTTEAGELDRKNVNYYVAFDGGNGLIPGTTTRRGTWIDSQYFVDWLTRRLELAVFGYLRSSRRANSAGVYETCQGVLEQARANGGVAPGRVSVEFRQEIASTFENPDFDGVLTNGYLLYVAPESARTQQQRTDRTLPNVRVWLRGSEAVHNVEIALVFEN